MYSKTWLWYSAAAVVLLVFGLVLTYQSPSLRRTLSQDQGEVDERSREIHALMAKLQQAVDAGRMRDISPEDIERFQYLGLDAREAIPVLYEFTDGDPRQKHAAFNVLKRILTRDDKGIIDKLISRGLRWDHDAGMDPPDLQDVLNAQYVVLFVFDRDQSNLKPKQRRLLFLYTAFRHLIQSTNVIADALISKSSPRSAVKAYTGSSANISDLIQQQNPQMNGRDATILSDSFLELFKSGCFVRFSAAFETWRSGSTGAQGSFQSTADYVAEVQRVYRYLFDRECGTEINFREKLFSE